MNALRKAIVDVKFAASEITSNCGYCLLVLQICRSGCLTLFLYSGRPHIYDITGRSTTQVNNKGLLPLWNPLSA